MTITQSDIPHPPEPHDNRYSDEPSSASIEAALTSLTDAAAKLEALHFDIADRKRRKTVERWMAAQVQVLRSTADVLPNLIDSWSRAESEFS